MSYRNYLALILPLIAGLLVVGCSAPPSPTSMVNTPVPTGDTATPAAQSTTAASTNTIRFEMTAEGTEARYRVREQLASLALPSDAVGVTSAVTGVMVVNADGTIVSDESKFVVDLTGLRSDQNRRDRYVQSNILQTNRFPTVEFVPKQIVGLDPPFTASGEVAFQLIGDLTVHGVTRSVTWEVKGTATDGRELTGMAATHFTFEDFGLDQPRVPTVLSVQDNIQLELDFHFVRVEP